ncbi:MAG: helix-turn-helix domain-containing protein [Dysgonamonadaceae bacterium]|jgi:hypothetical protein|nr:helix-turn-helix domain-containing protein [Dysgonamonadaceae bacterium]
MEIISIEKKAFEMMMGSFEQLADRIRTLCLRSGGKGMNKWYGNQEVCLILRISPRTLQTLRENGTLPFSQINRKIYYKPEDVQNAVTAAEAIKTKKQRKITGKNNKDGTDNKNR